MIVSSPLTRVSFLRMTANLVLSGFILWSETNETDVANYYSVADIVAADTDDDAKGKVFPMMNIMLHQLS